MQRRALTWVALCLALAGGSAFAMDPASEEDVARWVAVLDDPQAPQARIERALTALRAIATGSLELPATLEAAFAVARHAAGPASPFDSRTTIRLLESATALYPDDPRTPPLLRELAERQTAAGDVFGAHRAFSQLLGADPPREGPQVLARAAQNAARAGDLPTALAWALQVDPDVLDQADRTRVLLARVRAGEALGRHEIAREAARRLDREDVEAFHLDGEALLAAARSFQATGLWAEAIAYYVVFVNIYASAADHPEALLALGRLLADSGDLRRSESYLDWLIEERPTSPAAYRARLDKLELAEQEATAEQIEAYLELIRGAPDMATARDVAARLVERFLAAGLPTELFAALATLVREDERDPAKDRLSPLVARESLERSLESILLLLEARRDRVGLAAVAAEVEALDLRLPSGARERLAATRASMGLPPVAPGMFEAAVARARSSMERGGWAEAARELEAALQSVTEAYVPSAAEATRLLAECLWRTHEEKRALTYIDRALKLFPLEADAERAFHVLRGDILFTTGEWERACESYARAAERGSTRWVASQLARCESMQDAGRG